MRREMPELSPMESRFLGSRTKRFAALALGGLLTGLTLVLPVLGLLEWITLLPVLLFLLVLASDGRLRLRALYGYGVFFFMSYYLVVFHWFVNLYPLDFIPDMTKGGALSVVLLGWVGLSLFQALQGGLIFVLCGLLFRTALLKRASVLKPLSVAALWALYEWWQTVGWFGVPWGRLPLGQSKYLIGLQTASWFGPYFVTFLLVAVNGLLALIVWQRSYLRALGISVAGVILFQYGAGLALYFGYRDQGEPIAVAAAQGNISSHEKWDFQTTLHTLQVYERLTAEAAENGATLVVWPETALPYTLTEGGARWEFVSELAQTHGVTILVGAFYEPEEAEDFDEDEPTEYNALFCFYPDGSVADTVYAKRHLVPFGEYVPLRPLIETLAPSLADLVLSAEDIREGEGAAIIESEQGRLGGLICFDSIYESLSRESVLAGAEILCLSTNDSWFTDSVALDMHNAQAQLRAIETGRYVVRSANTGISTVISPRGQILDREEPLVEGLAEGKVYARDMLTLYTRIGNAFVVLCALALLAPAILEAILRMRAVKNEKNKK